MPNFQPISQRLRNIRDEDVLHEGVPPHLWASLDAWFRDQWVSAIDGIRSDRGEAMIHRIERECQLPLNWNHGLDSAVDTIKRLARGTLAEQEQYLDVLQCILASMRPPTDVDPAKITAVFVRVMDLQERLVSAGSAWTADFDGLTASLQRRVLPEVADRYRQTVTVAGQASDHLRVAWASLYGRAPKADHSYSRSVKAVEAVAAPIFIPSDGDATLGKCITALRQSPTKWRITLASEVERDDWPVGLHAVLRMMQALWLGQHDRHGDSDETKPGEVDPDEAEAALHISLTLVQLFRSGVVQRADAT